MSQNRIVAIDATRGTAMLFVFLSHFAESYVSPTGKSGLLGILYRISMVASPTFMLISGTVLGYLYETHKDDFGPLKRILIGRGLFLLTLGRVLIMLAHIPLAGGFRQMLGWGFITDAIGISVILGSLSIRHLRPSLRLLIGLCLYAVSWWVVLTWFPNGFFLKSLKYSLFGPLSGYQNLIYADVFPVVPWFSIYLVGSFLGARLGQLQIRNEMSRATSLVLQWALGTLFLAVVIHTFKLYLGDAIPAELTNAWFHMVQMGKLPPTILYFLFYGGIGLLFLYAFLRFERNRVVKAVMEFTRILGQVSLFVFILQYYVYFSVFVLLRLDYSPFWPLYFAVSIIVIYLPSKIFYDRGLNRYFIVPYSRLFDQARRLFCEIFWVKITSNK